MPDKSERAPRWHKIDVRMWVRNRRDLYNAVIFGAPRYQLWAWAVWRMGGVTSGVENSLQQARKSANGIIKMLEEGAR